ncbi:pentatricopeptide repeat-containing At5g47460 [Olea europaea subsp. europaea]|uniref:Pentatricopeptide repeat-containing At5g47460 n=1 Tax=Olea europaea subsp. europaea TaxID=158383 RepID=A0A8S0Q0Q9_OLEEU|nr:pentatricopeptide repeat-containing At5g47460 [Olea europaea subsp. europaea]
MLANLCSNCSSILRINVHIVIQKYQFYHCLLKHVDRNFRLIPRRNFITWTNLISGLAQGVINPETVLARASLLYNSGSKPNAYTLVHLTRACTTTGRFSRGQQLHSHILKSGFDSNVFVSTALVNFYAMFEELNDAQKLFVEIPQPSVVSWNSLISGFVRSGKFRKALSLFVQMEKSGVLADSYSLTAALSACGQLSLVQFGKSVHSKIVKLGVQRSIVVSNCLIDVYGKCGFPAEAIWIFDDMADKDTISWNSILAANARNGKLESAFRIFSQMPNPDTISYNELISGIAQFGNIEDGIGILSRMPNPNSSSWNSIITGFVNRSRAREALEFFNKMHLRGVNMDEFTFSSLLSGIASLSAITWGCSIHCCTVKRGLNENVIVGSAIIDMYFKCGQVKEAEEIFHSMCRMNLVTWNTMISGYAHNGDSNKVIQLFEQLKTIKDLHPDEITFLNVLSACWHSRIPFGIANQYFEAMIKDHRINPTPEHCSCMIRLMGHEGEVYKAEKMINELGFESCGLVWRTLLGACVSCGNIELAEKAAMKVIELERDQELVYVMMSNIYAHHGNWKDVRGIRELMKKRKVRKVAGLSWIEVENSPPT